MKKLIYLLFTALLVLSCNTSDDNKLNNSDGVIDQPDDDNPNIGYNMPLNLYVEFKNSDGANIFAPHNPLEDENSIEVNVYGENGYENEYPYPATHQGRTFIRFDNGTASDGSKVYALRLGDYLSKYFYNSSLQEVFNIRKWLKYRITFPDDTVYEVKVEGALLNSNSMDYYPTRIYVNDELKWEQESNKYEDYMVLTIVK